jgi:hypothetical protein
MANARTNMERNIAKGCFLIFSEDKDTLVIDKMPKDKAEGT